MAFELETAFFSEVRSTQIKKPGLKLVYLPGKGHVIVLIFSWESALKWPSESWLAKAFLLSCQDDPLWEFSRKPVDGTKPRRPSCLHPLIW